VLKNKREKTGLLPESLSSRELGPHQHLQARFSFSAIKKIFRLYRFVKGAGLFRRREITPNHLAARITLDELFTEALNAREIGPQEDIQARSTPKFPSETVARDDAADNFITSLLQSRDSEVTPGNIVTLASRVFDDLD
jgi:hypothetical protein